jgi:hypothetical protein
MGAQIVVEDVPQYLSTGLQLGERYEASPIVCPEATPDPADTWDVYTPIDRPGARAPHFWVAPDQSLYDLLGEGFTLLAFDSADSAPLEAAARLRQLPLKTVRLPDRHGLYRTALVLVRPDQHIAWHGDALTKAEAQSVIDRVRGASMTQ